MDWTAEWIEDGECKHKPYRVRNTEKWKRFKCSKCGYKAGRRIRQKYCPNCGRAMTPDARGELEKRELDHFFDTTKMVPLTKEQLRGLVGQWVWVVVNYDHDVDLYQCDGWALVPTPAFVSYLDQTIPIDFYGKKFLAYAYPPTQIDRGTWVSVKDRMPNK